eukprot:358687-Chlamydomonas_euryale.AAC.5
MRRRDSASGACNACAGMTKSDASPRAVDRGRRPVRARTSSSPARLVPASHSAPVVLGTLPSIRP